jgi:tetratricopeptide (TPR) repeat protein
VTESASGLEGDPSDVVALHTVRSIGLDQVGRPDDALAELRAAEPWAARSRLAHAHYLQRVALRRATLEECEAGLLEAARVAAEQGDTLGEAVSYSLLGHVFMMQGHWSRSSSWFRRSMELFGQDPLTARNRSVVLTFAGMLEARRGDVERASTLLEEAEGLQRLVGNRETLELTRIELAKLEAASGRPERAIVALRKLLAEIRTRPGRNAAMAHLALAEAELLTGAESDARQSAENALECARAGSYRENTTAEVLHVLAVSEALLGRPERAREHLREARELTRVGPVSARRRWRRSWRASPETRTPARRSSPPIPSRVGSR